MDPSITHLTASCMAITGSYIQCRLLIYIYMYVFRWNLNPFSFFFEKFIHASLSSHCCILGLDLEGRRSTASQRTSGRSLPSLLWGKSPCLWAESASRKPQDAGFDTGNDASSGVAVASQCLLQHQSHAVSALSWALTERGSLSPCLSAQGS